MRILIIGCGRLGAQCAQILHEQSHEVIGVKRNSGEKAYSWTMIYGDAADEDFFLRLHNQYPVVDAVLCCANPGFRGKGDNNLSNIIQCIRRHYGQSRLVYTSSTYVYGDAAGATLDETAATASDERAGKLLAMESLVAQQQNALILRISALYSNQRRFLLERMNKCETEFEVRGPLDRIFNYCHDDDAAVVCVAALGEELSATGIINVTAPDCIRFIDYCQHIMRLGQIDPQLHIVQTSDDQPNRRIDGRKLYCALPQHRWQLLSGEKVSAVRD